MSQVLSEHGQWRVTEYGVECPSEGYAIAKEDIWDADWQRHMSGKCWVDLPDFEGALHAARLLWPKPGKGRSSVSVTDRMRILTRDGFRCQLCGKGREDGVKLDVDHKLPKAKGGSNEDANLWTLCWACNHGKGVQTLEQLGVE